jgi:demethylmenaquinone methyltransferase/2-methoxy-6-polyprenyl-1,4-benzoquinol methylase
VVLEFTRPANPLFRFAYYVYFLLLLPLLGNLVSGSRQNAYGYLPRSVLSFPDRARLARIMEEAGLSPVRVEEVGMGIVTVHVGVRP